MYQIVQNNFNTLDITVIHYIHIHIHFILQYISAYTMYIFFFTVFNHIFEILYIINTTLIIIL